MRWVAVAFIAALAILVVGRAAHAQRGIGDPAGNAGAAKLPPVEAISGTVSGIKTWRCVATTGRIIVGAHLLIQTPESDFVDLYLGPAHVMEHILDQIEVGSPISFEAFRTDAMPENAYVAKTLSIDEKTIQLRDDGLHPSWTSGSGEFRAGMPRSMRSIAESHPPARPGPCWW